jgi:hypothetical protein
MNKSRWLVIVWVGLVASAGALASNEIGVSMGKSGTIPKSQVMDSSRTAEAYVDSTATLSRAAVANSNLSGKSGHLTLEAGSGSEPGSGALFLAGLGALAVAAFRRRSR